MASPLSAAEAESFIQEKVDPRGWQPERAAQEEGWLRNMAYFVGKQHFIQEGARLREPIDLAEHEVLYKSNLIKGAVARNVAKILSIRGAYSVAPASTSQEDVRLAELSDRVLEHQKFVTRYRHVKMLAYHWACICGVCYLKTYWDQDAGDADRLYKRDGRLVPGVVLSPEERAAKDAAGEYEDSPTGEVRTEIVSPFSLTHDWDARDAGIEGCMWIGESSFQAKERVAERFGVDPSSLATDESGTGPSYFEEQIAFMSSGIGGTGFAMPTPSASRGTRTRVVELWHRPTRRYKRGIHIVHAGGRLLINDENPYAGDRSGAMHLPYTMVPWQPVPGRFWPAGLVEDLTSPQFQYNHARATMVEFQNIFGSPPIFVTSASGIPTGRYTTEPGAIYQVDTPTVSDQIMPGPQPQFPSEVAANGEHCLRDLQMLSTMADPEMTLPGQIRSGAGIRAVQEERDKPLQIPAEASLAVDVDVGRKLLALGRMFYGEERVLRYYGDGGEWITERFSGADLNNDIRVLSEPGSLISSKAAERAEVLDMVEAGVLDPINNPDDRRAVLKALEWGIADEATREKLQDELQQEGEIARMIRNPAQYMQEPYPVMPWEDHAAHKRVLERLFRTAEFDQLDPATQSVLAAHHQMHAQAEEEAMRRQLEMMESLKGAPGEKGKASQPRR